MLEQKSDHISLTLPVPVGSSSQEVPKNLQQRKSLRRTWNQLPRCQRNLIILSISAFCTFVVLFLPGDQIVSQTTAKDALSADSAGESIGLNAAVGIGHINVAPFKDHKVHPKDHHHSEMAADTSKRKPDLPETPENANLLIAPVKSLDNDPDPPNVVDEPGVGLMQNDAKVAAESGIDDFINHLEETTDLTPSDFKGPSNSRQKAIVDAFKHSWKGYKEYAWGHDNLKPVSMSSHDWFGLGLTIVDSLDTMYIMDLQEEFEEARNWVDQFLNFDINRDVNLFEVTIRVLGGLLTSYHLSGDKMFLKKSVELGNRLLPCFLSPSGIPYSDVNLASMSAHSPKWSPDSSTSEVTTLQLEFRDLSRSTGNKIYEEAVHRVNEKIHSLEKNNGLVPIFINANTGTFRNFATISLGARGDSYYEYLLKQWIQTGRKADDFLIEDYKTAIDGVINHLVRKTPKEQHVYIGELINGKDFKAKMDHLTCYLPGTLLLGHKFGMPESHLTLARDLLETCYQTYMKQPTGLAPEITYFSTVEDDEPEIQVRSNDAHNLLRPEFIESLYYFYAITGNRTYQDMGWNIFQSFEKYTKVANGYSSIGNVKSVFNPRLRDLMESFWLGETLKYFYLLFSDDRKEIDLDKFIFNTEAHPLPIRNN
ncbi:endoplasmic reticulum mannosyl-oligosaccharide 1,2-alpha-mannosidase [Episyrphus balteatus]|uniref:endoplasmic reticulum mannosyl-oligosaccharide 1,2-alpha-mannosidase n=1 Tax=Episyrphus balteatus TaxID=286459 RepID=UPI002485A33A|nr:endoplasmic reticulum mannosyl-oligosaccharide 1,2-alpha-mannosidase [Episyrphus balteatus]